MGRRIVSQSLQSSGAEISVDQYFDRLLKYIPGDIVGAWVAAQGLIKSATDSPQVMLMWLTFFVGTVLTAVWTLKQTTEPRKQPAITQMLISTFAFIVWVIALGGPFESLSEYQPVYGSLLLIFYTLLIAIVVPPEK
jgi:uncharacterized membrane protein